MIPKKMACGLVFLCAIFALFQSVSSINVVPVEPLIGQVFNSSNNITFTCNATDEGQILNVSLYHNLNGTLSLNQTRYFVTALDENTSFLCRYDGSAGCFGLGGGTPFFSSSLFFEPGKFSQGVKVNGTEQLRYLTSGNFNRQKGTIEFWIKPMDIVEDRVGMIFEAADYNGDDSNEMRINFRSEFIEFEIEDFNYNKVIVHGDDSLWGAGEWHHVAAVWNIEGDAGHGYPVELYLDGVYVDNSVPGNYDCYSRCGMPVQYESASQTFSIGSDKYNESQMNSVIDDFRISNATRNESEINETYYTGLENHSSVSKSWDFYNVPDGSYTWSCLAYNGSGSNSSSARSFFVDVSTPPAADIFFYPNSTDDVDPGTMINFTANVSDPSGVSAVIFQWKEAGEGSWSSKTMAYNASSGLYWNASFQTIPNDMSIYYYRIWSNDTGGRNGTSDTQNITSEWDYTWTRSPATFGTVNGTINSVGNIGILTINNTGDRTLNFTLSDRWLLPVYYNGTDNPNFYVANHTAVTINVTAQFAPSDSENEMIITINASHYAHTPSPVSLTTNATLNSYSGGPYLSVSIIEYTVMASQSQTFNLTARLKNIGNETAQGVWLNWSLPQGWSNISGDAAYFAGNISPGSSAWSNLTVTVSPSSASPGTFVIYANSSCEQNVSGYDSKTIGVSCSNSDGVCGYGCSYVNDANCVIPQSAGAGGAVYIGGKGTEIQYMIDIDSPSSFNIERGERKTVGVKITNEGLGTNITGIYLLITGYPLTQITIIPTSISMLGYKQSGSFELEFSVPNYTNYGMHNLTLLATGEGRIGGARNFTTVEKSASLIMMVHSSRENETRDALARAEAAVKEMADAGLGTQEAESLLEQAKSRISSWDYDTSLETSKKVLDLRDKAFKITGTINQVEEGIKEAGKFWIQSPQSLEMAELSKSALQREDYAKAEERANNAVAAFVIEGQWLEAVKFIYANWQVLLAGIAAVAGTAYGAHRKFRKAGLKKRIALLESEEKATRKLMENAQEDMYREKILSKQDYHRLMAEHETNLAKVRTRKALLERRLIRLEKHPTTEFKKREECIKREIQGLQKRYFEQGSITKSGYQETVDELREELAESIKNMERVMDKRTKKERRTEERRRPQTPSDSNPPSFKESGRKGQAGFLAIGILMFLILAGIALAQDSGTKVALPPSSQEQQAALDAMDKAQGWIRDMEQLGFPAIRANDTLNEARLLFDKGYYQAAESLANEVEGLKKRAILISSRIDGVETSLYQSRSKGINVSGPQALFDEALVASKQEDYESAEALLGQASAKLEELESEYSMRMVAEGRGWEGLLKRIQDNILPILLAVAILTTAVAAGVKTRRKRRLHRRVKGLDAKAGKLNSMMKDLQTRYFEKGSVSESEYNALMERYRSRLAAAKRRKLALEGVLNKKQEKVRGSA